MKEERGMTLVELVIAIAVIGILVVALSFSFAGWRAGYHAESQTKEMYADLMHARIKALQQNRLHFVVVNQHHYQIYEDTDESGGNAPSGRDVAWWQNPKPFAYPSLWEGTVIMHTNGIVSTNIGYFGATVRFNLDLDGDGIADISPDYDCLVLFSTRINIGAWQAGKCVAS